MHLSVHTRFVIECTQARTSRRTTDTSRNFFFSSRWHEKVAKKKIAEVDDVPFRGGSPRVTRNVDARLPRPSSCPSYILPCLVGSREMNFDLVLKMRYVAHTREFNGFELACPVSAGRVNRILKSSREDIYIHIERDILPSFHATRKLARQRRTRKNVRIPRERIYGTLLSSVCLCLCPRVSVSAILAQANSFSLFDL